MNQRNANCLHAGGASFGVGFCGEMSSLLVDLVGEPDACRALSSCAEDAPPPMLMLRSRALCFESNWVASDSGIGDFGCGSYIYIYRVAPRLSL